LFLQRAKKTIPDLCHQQRDPDFIYSDPDNSFLGRLVLCEGDLPDGGTWSKIGRVEAYCFEEHRKVVLHYRLRHNDGDCEDWPPAATQMKIDAYTNAHKTGSAPSEARPMTSRDAMDSSSGWAAHHTRYLNEGGDEIRFHISHCKNHLGGEMNIDNGLLYISVCLSQIRNAFGYRAQIGDCVVLCVSSNAQTGIATRGVIFKFAILGRMNSLEYHHNEAGTKTSIYQVIGDEKYHRSANSRYHLTEDEVDRDGKGVVWVSNAFASFDPFNGVHCDSPGIPPYVADACVKHPFGKYSVPGRRSDVLPLLNLLRSYERRDHLKINLCREELEAGRSQSDCYIGSSKR